MNITIPITIPSEDALGPDELLAQAERLRDESLALARTDRRAAPSQPQGGRDVNDIFEAYSIHKLRTRFLNALTVKELSDVVDRRTRERLRVLGLGPEDYAREMRNVLDADPQLKRAYARTGR